MDLVPQLIFADALAPMDNRGEGFLQRAGVAVRGDRVVAVGPCDDLRSQFARSPEQYVPGIMLPGLINAHTHLELGYQRGKIAKPDHFTSWVSALMKAYPATENLHATIVDAVHTGAAESLHWGVTSVGDISRHCRISRAALAESTAPRPRVVSFGEVVGLGKMRNRMEAMLAEAADSTSVSTTLTIGISPHAPYTVEGPALAAIVQCAESRHLPIAMHLGELRDERQFLETLGGPLGRDWDLMLKADILDPQIPTGAGGSLQWAQRWGLLAAAAHGPVILVHVNYCDAAELKILKASGASVAYCPRTRNYFGHDQQSPPSPHLYREMLAAGVNVCLGTDSLASNPDLSILREAAHLCDRDALPAYDAIQMITRGGAKALGINAGVLAPGKLADISILPGRCMTTMEETLATVVASANDDQGAAAVWVGGDRVR